MDNEQGTGTRRRSARIAAEDPSRNGDIPPKYTINLALPPTERYVAVALAFKEKLRSLTGLFGDLVTDMGLPLKPTTLGARLLLRRLYSKEQTEEIRGISRVTGVDLYLLVAFNSVLDLLMGCTSGGARVQEGEGGSKMLHFRTLDWAMEPLREIVVRLEFVKARGGPVIARSVTYVGFVGFLTAVSPGLSLSLNFRPYHNDSQSRMSNLRFYGHLLGVLLGLKPSISAILRQTILPESWWSTQKDGPPATLRDLKTRLPSIPTTAAYLTFSDGNGTVVFEKDRVNAVMRSSEEFITITNTDVGSRENPLDLSNPYLLETNGMEWLVEDSEDRREHMEARWRHATRRAKRQDPNKAGEPLSVRPQTVISWLKDWPIANECTHYAVVMDPKAGDIVWIRRWLEPIEDPTQTQIA